MSMRGSRTFVALLSGLLAMVFASAASAAEEPSFNARGSAKQVYVTGLKPNAKMTLLNSKGKKVDTKRAGELGGLLFRHVKPGNGYRVRLGKKGEKSGPLTVLTTKPSAAEQEDLRPGDPAGRLRLHEDARRDEARLQRPSARGRNQRDPRRPDSAAARQRRAPDADRVLGLRIRAAPRARSAGSRSSPT